MTLVLCYETVGYGTVGSVRTQTNLAAPARPVIIQGGMGVGISSWQLARTVAKAGGLGVISGVAPDLLLARWLQDGDANGEVRAAMADYPDPDFVTQTIRRFHREGGRRPGQPYRPITKLDLHQRIGAVRLAALGAFAQIRLAQAGHPGLVGINLLEKTQLWTPAVLLGAMIAGVDYVLVGAGLPTHLPQLLNQLARLDHVTLPIDVVGAERGETFDITLDPTTVLPQLTDHLKRPEFLAIVSSNVLATYLARDDETRPDGFVIEGPIAGGHNAPPRKLALDRSGQPIYGPRDAVDIDKLSAIGLPFWLAGGYANPDLVVEALSIGAAGVQIGSAFALSNESGFADPVRRTLISRLSIGEIEVRTEPAASPTGFPFKVVQLPGTVAEHAVLQSRERMCDLSYLRSPYRRDDGTVGYRCPSEPVDEYLRKGGKREDTEGRLCLCNGLTATNGLAQIRRGGAVEPPLVTLGGDVEQLTGLVERWPNGWSARDLVAWLGSRLPSAAIACC